MKKKAITIILALALCVGLTVPAMATNEFRIYSSYVTSEQHVATADAEPTSTTLMELSPHYSIYKYTFSVGTTVTSPFENSIREDGWLDEYVLKIGADPVWAEYGWDGDFMRVLDSSYQFNTPGLYAWHIMRVENSPNHDDEGLLWDVVFFLVDIIDSSNAQPPVPPADIPSTWAEPEVNSAIELGLVPKPLQRNYTNEITRGEVAQMFINLLEAASGQSVDDFMAFKGVSINENAFTDTNDRAVLAASALGIINGVGGGRFDPDGVLTRAHIAGLAYNIANVLGINTEGYTHSFTDVSGHWVEPWLGWSVHAEIIEGEGNNKFNPEGRLTTEMAIVLAYRALGPLSQ